MLVAVAGVIELPPVAQPTISFLKEMQILPAVSNCSITPHPFHRAVLASAKVVEDAVDPLVVIPVASTLRPRDQDDEGLIARGQDPALLLQPALAFPHPVKLVPPVDAPALKHGATLMDRSAGTETMGVTGLEPVTSALSRRRSPN